MVLRTFGRKYLRVHRVVRWIGVPAGWHSHRRTCLTRKLVRSHLKNRSRRKPQYPNGGTGILALQRGEDVKVWILMNSKANAKPMCFPTPTILRRSVKTISK